MRSFIYNLLTTASFVSLQVAEAAGLPRHCFMVTEMHGVGTEERYADDLKEETDLLSDLPTLMAMYEPGMKLASITAVFQPGDTYLAGLQIGL